MGYTHYWKSIRAFTTPEWGELLGVTSEVLTLSQHSIPIAFESDRDDEDPVVSASEIRFNGIGDLGHETFRLTKEFAEFDFCKTAQKPYDEVVTAILYYVHTHFADVIKVSSDGDINGDDWAPGRALLARALGEAPAPATPKAKRPTFEFNGRTVIGISFGIGRGNHDVYGEANVRAVSDFLLKMNKQGEIGYWSKPIFDEPVSGEEAK